jgi:hypothetical protein
MYPKFGSPQNILIREEKMRKNLFYISLMVLSGSLANASDNINNEPPFQVVLKNSIPLEQFKNENYAVHSDIRARLVTVNDDLDLAIQNDKFLNWYRKNRLDIDPAHLTGKMQGVVKNYTPYEQHPRILSIWTYGTHTGLDENLLPIQMRACAITELDMQPFYNNTSSFYYKGLSFENIKGITVYLKDIILENPGTTNKPNLRFDVDINVHDKKEVVSSYVSSGKYSYIWDR